MTEWVCFGCGCPKATATPGAPCPDPECEWKVSCTPGVREVLTPVAEQT